MLFKDFVYAVFILFVVTFCINNFLLLLVIAGIIAILLKPSEDSFRHHYANLINETAAKMSGDHSTGTKIISNVVFSLANNMNTYTYSDYFFWRIARVDNKAGVETFVGAYDNWYLLSSRG